MVRRMAKPNSDTLEEFRAWRERNGVTQASLADAMGITPQAMSIFANGHRVPPLWIRQTIHLITEGEVCRDSWVDIKPADRAKAEMAVKRWNRRG